jgi:hypothetical protein
MYLSPMAVIRQAKRLDNCRTIDHSKNYIIESSIKKMKNILTALLCLVSTYLTGQNKMLTDSAAV